MKTTSPCLDCPKHGVDIYCHSSCPVSIAHEAEKKAKYAQQQSDYAIRDVHVTAILKVKKRKHLIYS